MLANMRNIYFLFLLTCLSSTNLIQAFLINQNVERTIDLTTQLVRESLKITVEESTGNLIKEYELVLPEQYKDHLAYISAKDGSKNDVRVVENNTGEKRKLILIFPTKLATQVLNIEIVLSSYITPYPKEIEQNQKQLVKYDGVLYFHSPYKTKTQTTLIKLSSGNIVSHTPIKPFSVTSNKIKYGPFENIKEFEKESLYVHYENQTPFMTINLLERSLEVSHWGNIAVKESIYVEHTGAKLKGSFSRYEFQRDGRSGQAAVKSYKTLLPASASDVYYRDSNGNISTSNMRVLRDSVELELRPRFPLFGGWKTHYVLEYNVPSFEYLFNIGDKYSLKMRLIDHVYDDMVIAKTVVKIILPEGSKNIELKTPYPIERKEDTFAYTYLDTIGRPVISFEKSNLVENHIADFELKYTFSAIYLLLEPLLVITFIFIIFLFTIIFMRLDFSITNHSHKE